MSSDVKQNRNGMSVGKILNLQVLRGVAVILVVWAHAIDIALIVPTTPKPLLAYGNFENFGAIGVDMFFVISGFIICQASLRKGRSWADFGKERFIRVVPMYYLVSFPFILHKLLMFHPPQISKAASNLLFWPVFEGRFVEPCLPQGWTLSFEVLFYAAMTVSIFSFARNRAVNIAPLATAAIFATFIALHFAFKSNPAISFIGNPIILEFLFGIAIYYLYKGGYLEQKIPIYLMIFAVLLILSELIWGYGNLSEAPYTQDASLSLYRALLWGLPAAAVVQFAIAVDASVVNPGTLLRLSVFIGDASYSIYLTHTLVMKVFEQMVHHKMIGGSLSIGLSTMISVCFGSLCYFLIERPLLAFLKRKFQPSRA